MEALLELIAAIIAFIIEVMIHALVLLFLLFMAIFSPMYRQRLREDWDTSNWKRFSIVLGIGMYSIALVFALFVWIPLIGAGDRPPSNKKENESSITIEFSSEEMQEMKETKEIDELMDVAADFIKRKLSERKQEAGTEQPSNAE